MIIRFDYGTKIISIMSISMFGGTVGVTPPLVTACCLYSLLFTHVHILVC